MRVPEENSCVNFILMTDEGAVGGRGLRVFALQR